MRERGAADEEERQDGRKRADGMPRMLVGKPGQNIFDGVVIDKRRKVQRLLILEFKRRTDSQIREKSTGGRACRRQGSSMLCQGIRRCLREGWECCFVPIVA